MNTELVIRQASEVSQDGAAVTGLELAAFGVPYTHVRTPSGDDLWLTSWGRSWSDHLDPSLWYSGGNEATNGTRLGFSTGCVYRVTTHAGGLQRSFVAKYSRVAQRLEASGLHLTDSEVLTSFRSPFEEFGRLQTLRQRIHFSHFLYTKRPLGIFSPAERVPLWRLDRERHEFHRAQSRLDRDQEAAGVNGRIVLQPDREYISLFSWLRGVNLVELQRHGMLSPSEVAAINDEACQRLADLGFAVADHKPDHVIVRVDRHGAPRRRRGQLVFALTDYELLEPLVSQATSRTQPPCWQCPQAHRLQSSIDFV